MPPSGTAPSGVLAEGQIFLVLVPLIVVCLASVTTYLNIYAGFVTIHIVAALLFTASMHRLTLHLLTQDEEKTELVDRLKMANQDLEVINRHLAGNARMHDIAATIGSILCRPGPRYGGEEFAVILPATPLDGAIRIAADLLVASKARAIRHEASVESLTGAADAALFATKREGRNRMHAAEFSMSAPSSMTNQDAVVC